MVEIPRSRKPRFERRRVVHQFERAVCAALAAGQMDAANRRFMSVSDDAAEAAAIPSAATIRTTLHSLLALSAWSNRVLGQPFFLDAHELSDFHIAGEMSTALVPETHGAVEHQAFHPQSTKSAAHELVKTLPRAACEH